MRRLLATFGMFAFALVAAPAARAAPVAPDGLVQVLADQELAYAKKGGKGWGRGWKGGRKGKWGGPPPWAPAHGLRRKRGW
jgi:hypothetical protein